MGLTVDYNVGMKGVDTGDQLAITSLSTDKSPKWYKKIFFNLFDMAVNAFSVHNY